MAESHALSKLRKMRKPLLDRRPRFPVSKARPFGKVQGRLWGTELFQDAISITQQGRLPKRTPSLVSRLVV